jgi:hopanoid biosynthesis associated RND transporter like protein HpnN
MQQLSDTSIFGRLLLWLTRKVLRHRRWMLYPQFVLAALCVLYTVRFLEFDTRRSNLVGSDKKYHQIFLKFKKEFPTQDDLVVVVESEDAEKNRQFVERLGARMEAETNLFHDLFYKGDLKMLGSKALLFVPENDLRQLKKTLEDYRPFILRFTRATNLVSLFSLINTQFRTARPEQNTENESMVKALPALERIVNQATDSLQRSGTPPSPGVTALFNPDQQAEKQIYITFAGGRLYLVSSQAPDETKNSAAVKRLRQLVDQTKAEVPGLNVGITGEPVLESDEMNQSQKDSTAASILSLLICALIFIYGYQETGRPVKATICLIVGIAYTMAFATWSVGHLNILTITFVPILIGLAIDFGVHLISRYEEELRHGKSEEAALSKAMVFTGQGIFSGAFTTAGAFLAMGLTNFKGIQEMGVICGAGLLICLIPMMTLLPVLLLRGRQNQLDHEQSLLEARRARIENLWLQRPWAVVGLTILFCVLAGTQVRKVYFDYNLLNMQSPGLQSVEFEKKLIASADKSVLYGALIATNLEQAIALEQQVTNLPSVASVDSISRFLSEDQTRKLQIVADIKNDLARLNFLEPDRRTVDLTELSATLYYTFGYLGAAYDEVKKEDAELARQLFSLRQAIEKLRKQMLEGGSSKTPAAAQKLAQFQQALFDDVRETFHALQTQDNSAPLHVADLPQALRDRFVGVTGKHLLMVYPKEDVWQRQNQKQFITELRGLDPNVTGTPVQLFEYTTLLKNSYEQAAQYALMAIALLVFIHFRSPFSVAMALLPVAIGFLWLGGLMGYFGIPLNPANIMMLPLIIGIGVTNGIHILNRFAEEQTPSILARSTGKAVLVSGLTTIAGFGSLIIANHQGIKSLGYVMASGVATCMLAGLTFLPALLSLLNRRAEKNQPSADNARSTLGREEPR